MRGGSKRQESGEGNVYWGATREQPRWKPRPEGSDFHLLRERLQSPTLLVALPSGRGSEWTHEAPGAERASTYNQACFPEPSTAATRWYEASCSYRSAAASSASVISNTVPLTWLSFLPLNVTLACCVLPLVATTCGSSILTNDGSNPGSLSACPWSSLPNVDNCTFSCWRVP